MSTTSPKKKEIDNKKLEIQTKAIKVDYTAFFIVNGFLFILNITTTPDLLWVIFPFFGWFLLIALHTQAYVSMKKQSSTQKKWVQFDVISYFIVNIFLLFINNSFTPSFLWASFPILGWLIFLSLHITYYLTFVKEVSPAKKWVYYNIVAYVTIIFFLLSMNANYTPFFNWASYPTAFWGFGLIGHFAVYWVFYRGKEPKEKIPKERKYPLKGKFGKPEHRDERLISRWNKLMLKSKQAASSIGKPYKFIGGSLNDAASEVEAEELDLQIKPKKGKKSLKPLGVAEPELSEEERIREMLETEAEVKIEKDHFICTIHRGTIDGTIYLCPECHSIYCEQCAKTLKLKNEGCWSCNKEIRIAVTGADEIELNP